MNDNLRITQEQLDELLSGLDNRKEEQAVEGKPTDIYDDIRAALPPFFTRQKAIECLNGLFTFHSLCNATNRPGGPPVHHIGKRTLLRRDEFVDWLRTKGSMFDGNTKRNGGGVRPTENTQDGTGTSGGGNQEGSRVGTKEPNPLGNVFAGLEDS